VGGLVAIMDQMIDMDLTKLREPEYDIAVLLPTRGRGKLAERALLSLIDNATDNSRIEYRIALDQDDSESLDYFKDVIIPKFKKQDINFDVIATEPLGYSRLNEYVNYLGSLANAEWLMFWNDDAIMNTKGWDDKIAEHTGKFRVLRMQEQTAHPYAIFPIVPKDWYHLLGTLSSHQMSDAQISQIGYMCNIVENIDVNCTHDRFDLTGNNKDETFNNRPQLEGHPDKPGDLNHADTIANRYQSCFKIMWYLRKIGQYNDHFDKCIHKKDSIWKNDPSNLTSRFGVKNGSYQKIEK
jgi:hypothetical protein